MIDIICLIKRGACATVDSATQHIEKLLLLLKQSTLSKFSSLSNNLVTRSSSTLTLLRSSVTSSLKFSKRSIAIAVPPLWNKLSPVLRQIPSYERTQTSPHAISQQPFHSKVKTLIFSNSYPDSSSFYTSLPRLNSKHHPP